MAPEAHLTRVVHAPRPGAGSGALAFERVLTPPGWLAPVQIVAGLAGLAGAAWSILSLHGRLGPLAAVVAALACASLLTLGAVRARMAHRPVVLRVDGDGLAQVEVAGRLHDCRVHRWRLADRWVTLALRLDGGTSRTLSVVATDQGSAESWRRLRVWLHWLALGPQPLAEARAGWLAPTPASSPPGGHVDRGPQ